MNNLINKSPKTFGYIFFVFASFVFGTENGYKKWVNLVRDKNIVNLIKLCIYAGTEHAAYSAALPVLIPFCTIVLLNKMGYIGSKI